jgi:hypothetical protein
MREATPLLHHIFSWLGGQLSIGILPFLAYFPYLKNKRRLMRSPCALCIFMCMPPIVAGQCLGKHVPAATNTHATIEEFMNVSFSMRPVSCQRKVGD